MTTVQESTNGHRVSPLPCPFPDSQEENQSKDSLNNNNSQFAQHGNGVVGRQKGVPITPLLAHEKVTETFPANAYHVPPTRYAPKPHSYRHDDFPSAEIDTSPLPERCQFMFSDGRQCTMGRSEIHPSLCPYHSEREDQLFGTPSSGGSLVGAAFDLPELYSACRDLTTAAGVNRALAQVFRLLAQRRISRQEAATFAKLGHLLLQTISTDPTRIGVPSEYRERGASPALFADNKVVPSSGESHGHQELSPVNKVHRQRGASPALLPHNKVDVAAALDARSSDVHPNTKPHALSERTAAKNSSGINTSATPMSNSREINTSTNAELKVPHNQHLHNNGHGANEHPRDGRASQRRE